MSAQFDFSRKIDRILIFDWDGVVCNSDHHAEESMRHAMKRHCFDLRIPYSETFFQEALQASSGTTEQTFLAEYMSLSGQIHHFPNLTVETESFDVYRRRYWERHKINDSPNIYPDFLQLLRRCKAIDRVERKNTIYAIGTGNPDLTFAQRIPGELAEEFHIIKGGVSYSRRFELVSDIFSKVKTEYLWLNRDNERYIPWRDCFRHTVNYYVDDTIRAIKDVAKGYDPEGMGARNVNIPNLRLIHLDRKHKYQQEFGELKDNNLLLQVSLLNDPRLFQFLNPRSHEPLEGKFLYEELAWHRDRHKEC